MENTNNKSKNDESKQERRKRRGKNILSIAFYAVVDFFIFIIWGSS